MKIWQICELDVGDGSDIVHANYFNKCNADNAVEKLKSDPLCEIPFYVVESEWSPNMKMEDPGQILTHYAPYP